MANAWNGHTTEPCPVCGKQFRTCPAWKRKGRKTCSRACKAIMMRPSLTAEYIAPRFWERVVKNGPLLREDLGRCWSWSGTMSRDGYGVLRINPHSILAHRTSWFLHTGAWPALLICHRCDNPSCTRPDHLFEGTQKDNMSDAAAKGRMGRKSLALLDRAIAAESKGGEES